MPGARHYASVHGCRCEGGGRIRRRDCNQGYDRRCCRHGRRGSWRIMVKSESGSGEAAGSSEGGNTNPYDGPVEAPVIVVDGDGNTIPVAAGERITSSPNGEFQQVRDADGNATGTRLDKGGQPGQADPKARSPHAHRPGVTDETDNHHLPLNEPKQRQ